jgi:hypothetical protein
MPHTSRPVSRRWLLFLPFVLVVVLAAVWSGLWFKAASRAETEVAALQTREARAGRSHDCASRSVGGYPFRIEVRCAGASFELAGTPPLRLSLPAVVTAAQVYDPGHLIAEFRGPLEIAERGRAPSAVLDWRLAQASVRGLPSAIDRASLVLEAPGVRDPGRTGSDVVATAQRFELHGRPAGSAVEGRSVDIVVRLERALAEQLHPAAGRPIDAEIAAVLHGVDDVSPGPWPARLRQWQARGGRIEIMKSRIAQEGVIATGAGTLRLGASGRLDGDLQVSIVGIEKVLKMFDIDRVMSEGQIGATLGALDRVIPGLGGIARQNAGPGLVAALGKRTMLEDKPAVAFPLRFTDGTVYLGPFQIGTVPPLF